MNELLFIVVSIIIISTAATFLYKQLIPGAKVSKKSSNKNEISAKISQLLQDKNTKEATKLLELHTSQYPKDIKNRFILAKIFYDNQDYKTAKKHLGFILKTDSKHLNALKLFTDILLYEKAYTNLPNYLKILTAAEPTKAEHIFNLVLAYEKTGKTDLAIPQLKKLLDLKYDDVISRKKLAELYEQKSNHYYAINEYEKVIKLMPDDFDSLRKLAFLYKRVSKIDEAEKAFEQLLSEYPDDFAIGSELAELFVFEHKFEKAISTYNSIINNNEELDYSAINRLAQIYILNGQFENAINECNSILKENNNFIEAKITLAEAYENKLMFDEATSIYKELIINAESENDSLLYKDKLSALLCNWGVGFYKKGAYQEALDKFVVALHYNDENADIYFNIAKTNQSIKNYEIAISYFKRALYLSPEDSEINRHMGGLYDSIGEIDNAINNFILSLNIDPKNYKSKIALGIAYACKKMYDKAIKQFEEAVAINPDDADIYYNLAVTYEQNGLFDKAKLAYQKVLEIDPEHFEAENNLAIILKNETN